MYVFKTSHLHPHFFFLQIAALSFQHLLDCLHSPESLPWDVMTGYEALCLRDIHFAPLQWTLNMQWVSLIYLKSLVTDNAFQPEGIKPDAYCHITAILIVFLSNAEHQVIEHVHIGLVVWHEGCCLYMQNGILPFMKSIEANLKKVRHRHAQNKDPSRAHSYSLLIANYGGVMAVPTDTPYCLVYPTMYNDDAENQNHFNTAASLSGLHTNPASVTPCFSMWIYIQSAGESMRAATSSFPTVHSTGPCFQRSLCHTTTGDH